MDCTLTDAEYKKCKILVKRWEYKFQKLENRKPTKEDIKVAPSSVKEAYRIYWLLKTSALEESILCEENEKLEQEIYDFPDSIIKKSINDTAYNVTSIENSEDHDKEVNKKSVWDECLRKKIIKNKRSNLNKSTSCQFSEKLFEGTSFRLRNPRLSKLKKHSKNLEKSFTIDENSQSTISENEFSVCQNENDDLNSEILNFDSDQSIKIISCNSSVSTYPINLLQQIENSIDTRTNTSKNIDKGWLERCDQKNILINCNNLEEQPTKKLKSDCNINYKEEQKKKILLEKVRTGKINDNFVSVNVNKKKFVRGKKFMTYSKYKQNLWNKKKEMLNKASETIDSNANGVIRCYRCNDIGHFSKQCKKNNFLLDRDSSSDEEKSPFPTLDEAAMMIENCRKEKFKTIDSLKQIRDLCEEDLDQSNKKPVAPLYNRNESGFQKTPNEVFEALKKFGYNEFRNNQESVIMRILSGKSTILVSSTGSGKSLCYQIPAYLYSKNYSCISLVISPLVSLMEDQILNLPRFLKAACFHTNQTSEQRDEVIKKVRNDEISILFLSPEAIIYNEKGVLGQTLIKNIPSIAFACIDEVHCISEWSHNFRSSYFMICKVLKEKFNVKTFLGLTATASKSTVSCIMQHLDVSYEAVIQDTELPKNLILSTSKDENRDNALISLLSKVPFNEFNSIIVYCLRRIDCERLAILIRTVLRYNESVVSHNKRRVLSNHVEAYHAGLSTARRKVVQKTFMSGKLRIVVATIAFGMGINKADIRGIIHYNMPRNFENYVQEIGRAGRDGLPARCHLFLNSQEQDLPDLKKHIQANSVPRFAVRKILRKIFIPCSCSDICEKHEVAFPIDATVSNLNLQEENVSTLLCYLELLPTRMIQVLSPSHINCTVQSYRGHLEQTANKCPVLAYIIAERKNSNPSSDTKKLEFSIIELANKLQWDSNVLKNELKSYEWIKVNDKFKKSGIVVTFSDVGFRVRAPGNLKEDQLDSTLDTLYAKVQHRENTALYQLELCHQSFNSVAFDNVDLLNENKEELLEKSNRLKVMIQQYFTEEIQFKNDDLSS